MCVIKDEFDHCEVQIYKNDTDIYVKRVGSGSDLAIKFRIRTDAESTTLLPTDITFIRWIMNNFQL